MSDSSDRKPEDRVDIPIQYHDPFEAVRTSLDAEGSFISNNGVLFAHWKAMPCVIGQKDLDGIRKSFDHAYENAGCPMKCENGFSYEFSGYVYGIFVSNSKNSAKMPGGFVPNGQAYVTLNRYYKNTETSAYFSEYDKLIPHECPEDFKAENFQKFQHNPSGVDRLQFPAHKVQFLHDSDGKRYTQDVDFTVVDGQIKWGDNRPGFDNQGKPKICSVRYTYQPYYYVKYVLHEQRLKVQVDPYTQEGKVKTGPTQCLVEQDFVFLDSRFKDNQKDSQLESGKGGNSGPEYGPR
jgi:hypothetical protein